MQKLTKKLSLVMVALMTVFTALSYMPAKAATVVPTVQFVGKQETEFTAGERITFNLNAANYGGRVQYRVVLWNDATKSSSDLWNTADRYYANWMPYGNETLPLGWVINEPGSYRITIYAKRAGLANGKTALKGMNCDSYKDGIAFTVKPAAVTPESIADVTVEQGATPVLPTEVTLKATDGTTKTAKVTWVAVDTSKVGTFVVEGTVEGTTEKAKVNVIVKAVTLTVDSVKAITNTKVDVILTDAVKTAPELARFSVKAGDVALEVKSATLAADGKSVRLVTATQTPGTLYTVKIDATEKTFVGLVADAVKPALQTVVSVNNKLVEVTFAATDATAASVLNPANYTIEGLTVSAAEYVVNAAGTTLKNKIYLTTTAQSAGTVYTLKVANIVDESDNAIDSTVTLQFAGKAGDTTAPSLTTVSSTKGNKLTVKLSDQSQLDENTLTPANFTVEGLTITGLEVDKNIISDSEKVVILNTSAQEVGKVYTLKVSGVKDVFGNAPSATLSMQFAGTPADVTPPSLLLATSSNNTEITLDFNDDLEQVSAENVANYSINNSLVVLKAELDEYDASIVYLTTTAQVVGTVYRVTVSNVKDEAGNTITTSQTYYGDFAGRAADTNKPTVLTVNALAGNKIEIVFSEPMDATAAKTLSNYVFDGSLGYPTTASYTAATNKLTLGTATQASGKVYTVTINNVKDAAGNVIAADTKASFAGIGSSADAVSLESVVALNSRQIQVKFNKPVENVDVTDFSLKQGSAAAVPFENIDAGAVTPVDDQTYILTLLDANKLTADVYTLVVDDPSNISDLGSTVIDASVTARASKVFGGLTNDPVGPKVLTVTQVSEKVIEVIFDQPVAVAAFTSVGNLTVNYDGTPIALSGAATYVVDSVNEAKVRFTFANPIAGEKVATLTLAAADFAKIKDATGNFPMVANNTASGNYDKMFGTIAFAPTALKLASAVSIDEQTIELTFNQDINYTTQVNPAFIKITDASGTEIVGYTLKHAAKSASNKVKVSYIAGANIVEGTLYKVAIQNGATGDELFTTVDGVAMEVAADATVGTAAFGYNATENVAPSLVAVTPLSATVLQLTFSEALLVDPTINATTPATDIEIYNGATKIGSGLAIADMSTTKTNYKVTLTAGVFLSGATYKVVMPTGLTLTDKYGIDTIKKTVTTEVKVTFGGVGTLAAPTATLASATSITLAGAGTVSYVIGATADTLENALAGTAATTIAGTLVTDGQFITVAVKDAALNTSYAVYKVTEAVDGTMTAVTLQ